MLPQGTSTLRWIAVVSLALAPLAEAQTGPTSETVLIQRRALRVSQLPPLAAPPQVEPPAANPIDAFIVAAWQSAKLDEARKPPPLCDDTTFVRRAYLDLIGVIPTMVETNRFLADSSAIKRAKLIDQLLARRADYAAHWTPFWEDALASQTVLAQGLIPTRGNYRDWIFGSFERNKPYDVFAAELLDPTMPGRKPPEKQELLGVPYSLEYVRNEDLTATLQTAANVAQVFLGTSMKCASCHDHFENREWTQDRFLGFAGLFSPRDLERVRCDVKSGKLIAARFPFELPGPAAAIPTDLEGRLHALALWLTDPANPRFAKTIVNRLWKRQLGWGLIEPVDDFREDTPASHPELLEWLARDFLEHGCDVQHTLRLICNSRTYQLRYDPRLDDHFDVGRSSPRYFRSPRLRRLTAEQLIDSVVLATRGEVSALERSYLDPRSTTLTRSLGKPASRNEISTTRPDDAAVVQSLELLNGREFHTLIYDTPNLGKANSRQDPRLLVDRLYRTVLSRPATVEEKRLGREFLTSSPTLAEGIADMYWALICTPEFQYIR